MDKIIGLWFETTAEISQCSAAMRRLLALLVEHGLTFDHLLYPYADALLLDDTLPQRGGFFGTHALLWEVGARELARCAVRGCEGLDIRPRAVELDCSQMAVSEFFRRDERLPAPGQILAGQFDRQLAGAVRPWSIRECARRFCSFAEHTARMEGVTVLGTAGGSLALTAGADTAKISSVYAAKTGCECRVLEYK